MKSIFIQPDNFKYPSDNFECFEDYFIRTFKPNGEPREFIPVAWTSFYRRAAYGKDEGMKRMLQKELLNKLDTKKKYFTVVTWDDGILNSLAHLDVQVFAACGPRIDFAIPLLCQPHRHIFPDTKKDILCSFVGSLNHPIRQRIVDELSGVKGFYISTKGHNMQQYCNILARSKYVLCPRGYGITSFRICEALQYGAIAVYITDRFGFMPLDAWSGPVIPMTEWNMDEFKYLKDRLANIANETNANRLYNKFYTYESCKQLIIENIK